MASRVTAHAAAVFGCLLMLSLATGHVRAATQAAPCTVPERLRLRVIQTIDSANAKAADAALKAGAAFHDVLVKYDYAPLVDVPNDGEAGWTWLDTFPASVATQLAGVPVGKSSAPFKADLGLTWLIVQVEDRDVSMSCDAYSRKNPRDPRPYDTMGTNAYGRGDYGAAIVDYSRAIELDPKNAQAYYGRALAYNQGQKYEAALSDMRSVVASALNDANSYAFLGYLESQIGDDDLATADDGRAVELDPTSSYAKFARGTAYFDLGYLDAALSEFSDAIRLGPSGAGSYSSRGMVYFAKGDATHAIADYDVALRLDRKDAGAYLNRGIAYVAIGQYARAQADFGRAHAISPSWAYAALWRDIAATKTHTSSPLRADAAKLDLRAWPGPIVQLYLGRTTLAAVTARARSTDALTASLQLCETQVYGGLYLREHADPRGTALLATALRDCPDREAERWFAVYPSNAR